MTGSALKIIAILSMAIDHVGFALFPGTAWLRIVGRLAFPLFALSAAEGARFTHDRKKYLSRLLFWGLVSEIPFNLLSSGAILFSKNQNVCFTLAAGVACIYLLENMSRRNRFAILAILAATCLLNTDYSFAGAISVIIIHNFSVQGKTLRGVAISCLLLSMIFSNQFYCFMALIPIMLYNGKPGLRLKYLFYVFYPLHMLIIWAVRVLINTTI